MALVVMKQSSGTYAPVGTTLSYFADYICKAVAQEFFKIPA